MAATAAAADVLAGDCRQRMSVGCRDVYRLLTPSSSEEGSSIPDHRLTLNDSAAFPFDTIRVCALPPIAAYSQHYYHGGPRYWRPTSIILELFRIKSFFQYVP